MRSGVSILTKHTTRLRYKSWRHSCRASLIVAVIPLRIEVPTRCFRMRLRDPFGYCKEDFVDCV